ncbi:MAG: AAA family ATPase [Acidobacteriota bacterium]
MFTQNFEIAGTFNIAAPRGLTVKGCAEHSPFVPKIDPNYVFQKEVLRDVLCWLEEPHGDGLYLSGPTGCGKSSLICQVAARLNIPVQPVAAHSRLEIVELIGHLTLVNGSMSFADGPITTAMRHGHLLLIDELDLLEPATAVGLNSIIEGRPLLIPQTGELIVPHEDFRIAVTGNTAGAGDTTGLYQGTLRQNLAFMDRFRLVQVSYPAPDIEQSILSRTAPVIDSGIREKMIAVANEIRRLFIGESNDAAAIEITMSTRSLVRWAHLALAFKGAPLSYSMDRALTFRAQPETREAVLQIVQRHFGSSSV